MSGFHFKEKDVSQDQLLLFMAIIPISLMLYSLYWTIFNSSIYELLYGLVKIQRSPTILMTDFFEVGGIGSASLNAGLIGLVCLWLAKRYQLRISGIFIASFLTAIGFAFFGENLFNILPIYFGGYLYTRKQKSSFRDVCVVVMFGSGLSPIVSEICYAGFMPQPQGLIVGMLTGILIGFIISPFSSHTLRFHDGFNLYNIGFAVGVIGTFLTSILRSFNIEVRPVDLVHENLHLSLIIYFYLLCIYFIVLAFYINRNVLKAYTRVFKRNGRLISDFTYIIGYGASFLNMGLMGIFAISFVLLMGGVLNGPTISGILTIIGFSAFGKHFKNSIPVMAGVIFAAIVLKLEVGSTSVLISVLFSTGLAPIAGAYGPFIGFLAGLAHLILVRNIGIVHGGMNLLNNGFSAGVIAALFVPILDALKKEKIKYEPRR